MSPPTVFIVPGAFLHPSCFDSFVAILERAGYPTVVATLPSSNPSSPETTTCASDAIFLREKYLTPLIDGEGKEVLLLLHSYGGLVGGAAACGFSLTQRAADGKEGGVIGLAYLSGNIVAEGIPMLQIVGGEFPPFIKADKPSPGLSVLEPAIPTLYADVEDSVAKKLEASMLPHSMLSFTTPAPAPAWAEPAFQGRRAYVRTLQDCCLPANYQKMWIEGTGVEWIVKDVDATHAAFVSKPEEVAGLVLEFAKQWATSDSSK